jgi:FAD:protein FMN transferase
MNRTELVMGMPVTVQLVAEGVEAEDVVQSVFDWFDEVDRTFSTYKAYSAISRMNAGALRRADAPMVVREVLAAGEALREATDDYFEMWRPDGQLDPSGYVKGWAIEQAAEILQKRGFRNYCVEAGGDVQTGGRNAAGKPWRVGVRNPLRPAEIVKVLQVSGGAVATSGTYERGEHIYDPKTGHAAAGVASVTVVGLRIAWADVAATAAFAMGAGGAGWLARQHGLEAYVIGHDGQATFTPGLERYLELTKPSQKPN